MATTIAYHNVNHAVTHTSNGYNLSYHITYLKISWLDISSFVKKQSHHFNAIPLSGNMKGSTPALLHMKDIIK